MGPLRNKFRQLIKDQEGATAIEYGLFAALIALVIIGAIGTIGENLTGIFENIAEKLSGVGE